VSNAVPVAAPNVPEAATGIELINSALAFPALSK